MPLKTVATIDIKRLEILDVEQLTELKMGALLAVGQGSVRGWIGRDCER